MIDLNCAIMLASLKCSPCSPKMLPRHVAEGDRRGQLDQFAIILTDKVHILDILVQFPLLNPL